MSRSTGGTVSPLFSENIPAKPLFRSVGTEVQRATAGGGWQSIAVCDDAGWSSFIALALAFAADPASPLSDHDLASDG